jgi:hypothetical protein
MPRLSPSPGNQLKFNSGPFDFDIEIGDESADADVYAALFADNVKPDNLTVKINGAAARLINSTEDGLYLFEVDHQSIKSGINKFFIAKEGMSDDTMVLKDGAIFFCRDKDDLEMRKLIALFTNKQK